MIAPYPCPECGGVLDVDEAAQTPQEWFRPNIGGMPYLETILRPCVAAGCTSCEFVIEVNTRVQRDPEATVKIKEFTVTA
jgi:hypothetical protein